MIANIRSIAARRGFSTSASASNINRVILVGRIGNEPEQHTSKNGKAYVTASLATNTLVGEDKAQLTQWHRLVSFNENQHNYLTSNIPKGSLVYIEGSLNYSTYQNKDGVDQNDSSIRVDRFQLLQKPSAKEATA